MRYEDLWNHEPTKKADIWTYIGDKITIRVILGHIDYPEEWIMDVNPPIFGRKSGTVNLYMSRSASGAMAMEAATIKVRNRLKNMLEEVTL